MIYFRKNPGALAGYYSGKGKYQEDFNVLMTALPDKGRCDEEHLECFRCLSNLYFDVYMHDCANLMSEQFRWYADIVKSHSPWLMDFLEEHPTHVVDVLRAFSNHDAECKDRGLSNLIYDLDFLQSLEYVMDSAVRYAKSAENGEIHYDAFA